MTEREEQIVLAIYDNIESGEVAHRSGLIETLSPLGITEEEIDDCLMKLVDTCITEEDWHCLENGKWVRAIRITTEYMPYFRGMATHSKIEAFFDEQE